MVDGRPKRSRAVVSYNQSDLEKNRNGTTPTWLKKVRVARSLPGSASSRKKPAVRSGTLLH